MPIDHRPEVGADLDRQIEEPQEVKLTGKMQKIIYKYN